MVVVVGGVGDCGGYFGCWWWWWLSFSGCLIGLTKILIVLYCQFINVIEVISVQKKKKNG